MRKLPLLIGALSISLGLGAVSTATTATAACLNPDAGLIDLSHDPMKPGAGFGYDKATVDRELAKGNRCTVVQQSQPVTGDQLNDFRPLNNKDRNGTTQYR
ncbi:MAG: hypothetical protein ACTHOR_19080 [Devosia sp.]|jgi:hypothetical protein